MQQSAAALPAAPLTLHPAAAPELLLSRPRGFCAGVVRAIAIVERALQLYGTPVYVFHEIVHNGHVVADLRSRGAVFVDSLEQVPVGSVTVFSAHGVSLQVVQQAEDRDLKVIDATCPLVSKVHLQVQRYARSGHTIIVIGHAGHEEVEGTMGRVTTPVHLVGERADVQRLPLAADTALAYVSQTTLSLDDTRDIIAALRQRFPQIVGPDTDDICYATQNRQSAVRALAAQVDLVLVVGARNSSNSMRLREVAAQQGVPSHLVQDETGIDAQWLVDVRRIGITAGASTPEVLVQRVATRLRELGAGEVRQIEGQDENIVFRLPVALLQRAA
jgi:4-hydroxy-3-methylbut-2-enyl diphosphate reductase